MSRARPPTTPASMIIIHFVFKKAESAAESRKISICFFVVVFLPFITLFSPSSDIQGVGEGHPPACLTNYKYGILMVTWYACSLLSFICHAF